MMFTWYTSYWANVFKFAQSRQASSAPPDASHKLATALEVEFSFFKLEQKMRTSYFLHFVSIFLIFHTFRSSSSIIFYHFLPSSVHSFKFFLLHKVPLLYFCSLTGTIADPSVLFCASLGAKDSHRISVPR